MLQPAHHHVQQVIHVTGQGMAGHHFWPGVDLARKRVDACGVVTFQLHPHEGLQAQPQALRVHFGTITSDHAFPLQPLHPAQAGRGREMHAFGQFRMGLAGGTLQFGQQQQIDAIQFRYAHFHHKLLNCCRYHASLCYFHATTLPLCALPRLC